MSSTNFPVLHVIKASLKGQCLLVPTFCMKQPLTKLAQLESCQLCISKVPLLGHCLPLKLNKTCLCIGQLTTPLALQFLPVNVSLLLTVLLFLISCYEVYNTSIIALLRNIFLQCLNTLHSLVCNNVLLLIGSVAPLA